MPAVTEQSMNLRVIKQQDLARMIANTSATNYANPQSEPYQGRTPLIPATIKSEEELRVYFARLGVYGEGTRADSYLAASINPSLAAAFPDDGVPGLIEIAETKREALKIAQPTAQQSNAVNKSSERKPYGANPYSYIKRALYSAEYSKLAAKIFYSGIEKMVKAFKGIRSVYHSSSGVFRNKKTYDGKGISSAKNNLVSLDSYRAARNQRQYIPPHSSLDLEERVA